MITGMAACRAGAAGVVGDPGRKGLTMVRMPRARAVTVWLLAAAAGVGLVGCAAEAPGQTVAEACTIVTGGTAGFGEAVSSLLTDLQTGDPAGAAATLEGLTARLDGVAGDVEAGPVTVTVVGLRDSLALFGPLTVALADPVVLADPAQLGEVSSALRGAVSAMGAAATEFDLVCAAG